MTPDEKDARFYPFQDAARIILREHHLTKAWDIWVVDHRNDAVMNMPSDRRLVIEIVGYAAAHGYLNERQLFKVSSLLQKIVEK